MAVSDSRYAGFFRSGDDFEAPLFFLMTLEAFDEPMIDGNFPACRIRAIAAGGLMALRFGAFLLLSAPESFGDPMVARHVWGVRRLDRFGAALGRAALAL